MSSHHFVKEGQEPALIIADASYVQAEPLLEWAPLVIAMAEYIDEVSMWGIKIDVVVGKDVDRFKKVLAHQTPVRLIESNDDFLGTALYFLQSIKQFHVSILLGNPQLHLNRLEEFTATMDITILSEMSKWSFVRSKRYYKWLPADATLGFHCNSKLKVNGREVHNNELLVETDGPIEVLSDSPFWIIESI